MWRLAGAVRNRPTTAISDRAVVARQRSGQLADARGALALLAWRRHWLRLAAFGLAVLTSEVLIGTVKAAVDRPRPPGSLIATSAARLSVRACDRQRGDRGRAGARAGPPGPARWRWEVYAVVFAVVMALSRVYLRAHWLSDTVAGGLARGGPGPGLAGRADRDPVSSAGAGGLSAADFRSAAVPAALWLSDRSHTCRSAPAHQRGTGS